VNLEIKNVQADPERGKVGFDTVMSDNETWFRISNYDTMRPFLMSIVSDSDHWMFISSNGGLTAGRKNPDFALFPYYTDDKITDLSETTGTKSIFRIHLNDGIVIWEPFSNHNTNFGSVSRNIYKSLYGNKILFEEINHDLSLTFRYRWNSSDNFGFIRSAELINNSTTDYNITLLDGIQNIMPYGVPPDLQCSTSNLVDAYKRSELEPETGVGIFSLSAIIVDKAEPSEALKANIVWSLGLLNPKYLLSSVQLEKFRQKESISTEHDVKGEKGAYYVCSEIMLQKKQVVKWKIVANVNQNHSQIIRLCQSLKKQDDLERQLSNDVEAGTARLIKVVSSADGLQFTDDKFNDARHFSNVLFNVMRGGIFDDNYNIIKSDFLRHLCKSNKVLADESQNIFEKLDDIIPRPLMIASLKETGNADLIRHGIEYLPLRFSRRHGDPSRPWNNFSINTRDEYDGSKILDYEGNWRDLFQNWEALACSYPEFTDGMIFKFLNASTFDGYNPYRVTKDGFDWEVLEPDNPWSYIGYWGDHQIIYMLKLLEISEKYYPGNLQSWFDKDWFVYASVPYIIKPYDKILVNPRDTIEFDKDLDNSIRKQRKDVGSDGALLALGTGEIYHVNFIEKILASVLAKVSNYIPEAGIWMNTQRPEWNDANNALVGNGISMVTLFYLYRFLKFLDTLLINAKEERLRISVELSDYYHTVRETLKSSEHLLVQPLSDSDRKGLMDSLGRAASEYRSQIYKNGFWGKKRSVSVNGLRIFIQVCIDFIEHSIRANQRQDNLFNTYNVISIKDTKVSISDLEEMLEGQVAVLSSGFLDSKKSLELLDALKRSSLFREDQYSYILYPEKKLPGFLQKNIIAEEDAEKSELIKIMVSDGNRQIVERDILGNYHFNGSFRNVSDLEEALKDLADSKYKELIVSDTELLTSLFEKVFNHRFFTGRSGTFFSYEGLGSIYWHMVSKLRLAVQETCIKAIENYTDPVITGKLLEHYYEIDAGIGVHKPPDLYGAFPTDPYSHTPRHRGAQQPGMTGQVKEDILARFGELGVFVRDGKIAFNPCLLRNKELLSQPDSFEYHTAEGRKTMISLKTGQLCFSFCNVPVTYTESDHEKITLKYSDGKTEEFDGKALDRYSSNLIFSRTGKISLIEVSVKLQH